jgi:GNAT superfamily N-acetyltransferase
MTRLSSGYRIEPARREHLDRLPDIELAAAGIFSAEDLTPEQRSDSHLVSDFECAAREGRLWTAVSTSTEQPVGFAMTTRVDGAAHLYELDVLPEHGRRGIGAALVAAVADRAREAGSRCVTLTTFRHVPWNAPFYARLGFRELSDDELTPGLAEHLRREADAGFDPEKRIAMRLEL